MLSLIKTNPESVEIEFLDCTGVMEKNLLQNQYQDKYQSINKYQTKDKSNDQVQVINKDNQNIAKE